MISLSKNMTDYINQNSRTFRAKVVTPTHEFSQEIMAFQLKSLVTPDDIGFGYPCSSYVDIEFYNVGCNFTGMEFELLVGASIDRKMEYISLGFFKTTTSKKVDEMTIVTAFDRMMGTGMSNYSTELVFPAKAKSVINELCKKCKLVFNDTLDEDVLIKENMFGECTNREVIGYLAGLYGKNAIINRVGQLEFRWFTDTNFVTDENRIADPQIGEADYELGYIKCNTGRETIQSGEGQSGFTINSPIMTQERLDFLFNACTPFKYRAADVDMILGDLRLEAGDIITVNYKGNRLRIPLMNIDVEYDGGVESFLTSYGKLDSEKTLTSISTKFTEIQNNVKVQLSDLAKATTALNDIISNSLGLYRTSVVLPDGSTKTYLHDKPKLESSFTIYTMTEGGFAFTKSGWNNGNPVWQYGIDKDGNAVLNTIVANALTAVHITGGLIEGTTIKGNEIVGGTITGTTINSDNVNITGGKIQMQGNDYTQFINLNSEYVSTIIQPRGIEVQGKDENANSSISFNNYYFNLFSNGGNLQLTPQGAHAFTHSYFSRNSADNYTEWGKDTTNFLQGTWFGVVHSSSDRNKKHNIEPLCDKYKNFFDNLQAVRFVYNNQEDEKFNLGFIAQDVVTALDEAGLTLDDFSGYVDVDGIIALNYQQFISLNTMMLQETRKELSSVKSELEDVKCELDEIRKRLSKLG